MNSNSLSWLTKHELKIMFVYRLKSTLFAAKRKYGHEVSKMIKRTEILKKLLRECE